MTALVKDHPQRQQDARAGDGSGQPFDFDLYKTSFWVAWDRASSYRCRSEATIIMHKSFPTVRIARYGRYRKTGLSRSEAVLPACVKASGMAAVADRPETQAMVDAPCFLGHSRMEVFLNGCQYLQFSN